MKKILSTITLFISLNNSLFSSPMDGIWKQYIYTDGISSNYIFDVEKDNKGRVWIGTQNGVTLIEGKLIQKFGYNAYNEIQKNFSLNKMLKKHREIFEYFNEKIPKYR